ncbi:MAG TPA: hypothetical protein VGM24_08190 [Puia sp.]|jgi:hypothetical protein
MKNSKSLFSLLAGLGLIVCLVSSCKKGNTGPQGPAGTAGAAGADGAAGAAGVAGADGLAGNTLLNGDGAPADDLGKNGDFYLDITAKALYGPKTASGWGSPVSIQGPQGEAGKDAEILVDTFTIDNGDWSGRGTYWHNVENVPMAGNGFPGMYVTRSNYTIDESILKTGLVMVSYRSSPDFDENRWSPLPYSFYGGTYYYNMDFSLALHQVTIDFYLTRSPYYASASGPFAEDMGGVTLPSYQVKVLTMPASVLVQLGSIMRERKSGTVSGN